MAKNTSKSGNTRKYSAAERKKMRETAAQGFEINVYNPRTKKWTSGSKK